MAYGDLSTRQTFMGEIDKTGTIYSVSSGRDREKYGIDIPREQELLQTISDMQETLDSWYPKMVEHGYIQIPKTPEEIAQEAADEQIRLAHIAAESQIQAAQEQARAAQEQLEKQAELMQTQSHVMAQTMLILQRMEQKLGGMENGFNEYSNERNEEQLHAGDVNQLGVIVSPAELGKSVGKTRKVGGGTNTSGKGSKKDNTASVSQ